mgnify:CR=1 FL=1
MPGDTAPGWNANSLADIWRLVIASKKVSSRTLIAGATTDRVLRKQRSPGSETRYEAVASSEFQRMIFSLGAFFVAIQTCSGEKAGQHRRWVLTG